MENLSLAELKCAFAKMNDDELHMSAVRTAEKERCVTLSLLRHLNEIERRHLFSKFNCSSLHDYCVKELKMSDPTAGRRVSAARLLRELPVVEEKILSGSVTLTSISQAGVFFRNEGERFNLEEKRDLVLELENKSTREVDRILISKSETPEIHFKEQVRAKTEEITEVKLHLDQETMEALEGLKEIWSHADPHATLASLIKRAAKEAVEKHDRLKKAERSQASAKKKSSEATPAPESKAAVRRQVWKRDQGQCTFTDPLTSEKCAAKHFLEEDRSRAAAELSRGGRTLARWPNSRTAAGGRPRDGGTHRIPLTLVQRDGHVPGMAAVTLYRFRVDLSDLERNVYEALDFRVAMHPSETTDFLLTRVIAYALSYERDLEFTAEGLSDPDQPALKAPGPHGTTATWIEIGNPSARKLHKAAKAATHVKVYTYKDPRALVAEATDVHRAEEIEVYAIAPKFLEKLAEHLERDCRWSLLHQDGTLTISGEGFSESTELTRVRLQP